MFRIQPMRSTHQSDSDRVSDAAHWLAFIKDRLRIPSPVAHSMTARNFLDGMSIDAGAADAGSRYFWFDDGSRLTISNAGEVVDG